MTNISNKIKYLSLFIFIIFLFLPQKGEASIEDKLGDSFPRLANYYLKWELNDYEAESLAKWDLLVLDMEVQENSPEAIRKIRELNPNIIILAYITAQEIMHDFKYYHLANLRFELEKGIIDSWYLRDESGKKISNWPGTYMLNLSDKADFNSKGQRFNDYLPEFVASKIKASGLWDGVFYDNTWGDILYINGGNIDFDNDGRREEPEDINPLWASGFKKMLKKTRSLVTNDFLIIGNGKVYEDYQDVLNGMMFENFPAPWEGTWADSITRYLKLSNLNLNPSLPILNTYHKDKNNFSLMRFGLTSTLLGNGFFSYDYDSSNHTQLWWYDEYELDLGRAISAPYNAHDRSGAIKNTLFRRDFDNASVFVNAGNKREIQIFSQENFLKPKGEQDPSFNTGERINFLDLPANTGAILLNNDKPIKNTAFSNGFFYRFFDGAGAQTKTAGFSFIASQPGGSEVFILSDKDGEKILNGNKGIIKITEKDKTRSFKPFPLFSGDLNLGVYKKNNVLNKIIVTPCQGGGPQVLTFDTDFKVQSNFFAYDKNSRTGLSVAVADLDGDGELEIITSPGKGLEPLIKVFSFAGELKASFLAYDKNFKGGVIIAAGDMNNDGFAEIITVPASGGGPHVRIFNSRGEAIGGFFAYDKDIRDKFKVGLSDVNNNGYLDIIVGRQNPY